MSRTTYIRKKFADSVLQDATVEVSVSAVSFWEMSLKQPFDRMLVWQAIQHDLTLVSRDRAMEAYRTEGLKILW